MHEKILDVKVKQKSREIEKWPQKRKMTKDGSRRFPEKQIQMALKNMKQVPNHTLYKKKCKLGLKGFKDP